MPNKDRSTTLPCASTHMSVGDRMHRSLVSHIPLVRRRLARLDRAADHRAARDHPVTEPRRARPCLILAQPRSHTLGTRETRMKSTVEQIRVRFDNDVERFSNLDTGQSATIDAPLVLE